MQRKKKQVKTKKIRTSVVLENPPPKMKATNKINNYEEGSGKTIEGNVEKFMDTLGDFPLIAESAKVTNNNIDELDEALEMLKAVHNMILTSSLLDYSFEDVEFLNIKNYLLSLS